MGVEKPSPLEDPNPDYRDEICGYFARQLLGPFDGANEVLPNAPRTRYLLGILYPQESAPTDFLSEEEIQDLSADSGLGASELGEGPTDEAVVVTNDWLPSSLGISFYCTARRIRCKIWGAAYEAQRIGKRQCWRRIPIFEREAPSEHIIAAPPPGTTSTPPIKALGDRAELRTVWRPIGDGFLVTVTLINASSFPKLKKSSSKKEQRAHDEACLHQIGFRCEPIEGHIPEYKTVAHVVRDDEDDELRLMYRDARVFAVGHGCSVSWPVGSALHAEHVETEHIPSYEVRPLTYDLEDIDGRKKDIAAILHLPTLITFDVNELARRLNTFVDVYADWIDRIEGVDIPAIHEDARSRIIGRLREVTARLRRGINLIETRDEVLQAFRLANRAMLMQRYRTREIIQDKVHDRTRRLPKQIDYVSYNYSWRPFQLAFQLLTLESVTDESAPDRDVVDLIWFPTGGGKTEAYLAVAAYTIFSRRLRDREKGAGTAVVTRYTLTLLTAQQFQRAATMICACEQIRLNNQPELGDAPISIGLWIGDEHTPNTTVKAHDKFQEVLDSDEPSNPFNLHQCPWCGTAIIPTKKVNDFRAYGIRSTEDTFGFFCANDTCEYTGGLPVQVIDDELYRNPPSFLLGTVDKFAMLAWHDRPAAFFGSEVFKPPSLIIQDELHLLSGPLGTTVGLYEAAIEALIELRGALPKVIASTATIRRAGDQVTGLFGRRRTSVFPAPGIDAGDSFFARVDTESPGRRYVGVMPQSHSTQTSLVNTSAALLQVVLEMEFLDIEAKDAYWTLVMYHNSLRELGRTVTLAKDDIPLRLEAWTSSSPERCRDINEDNVIELRSRIGSDQLTARLQQLKATIGDEDCLSIVACTNIFSVGVDVSRLGVMLMNGQPKSTSEYIQATSRVGRGKYPGLVVALYGPTRPRDRSHYEQFLSYHSALYKHVEPTSVTPFSPPSRERALHAGYVILMRHWGELARDDQAGSFRAGDSKSIEARDMLLAHIMRADPEEYEASKKHLDELMTEWDGLAVAAINNRRYLYYKSSGKSQANLLKVFGRRGEGWPTLTSMRSVDVPCRVWVLGESDHQ